MKLGYLSWYFRIFDSEHGELWNQIYELLEIRHFYKMIKILIVLTMINFQTLESYLVSVYIIPHFSKLTFSIMERRVCISKMLD